MKAIEERSTQLENVIRQLNEERIKAVPESMRGIIPTDYPPEKLQEWLVKNAALLVKEPAVNFDACAGGSGGSPVLPVKLTQEQKEMARLAGMTEKEYADYLGKKGQPVEPKKK